MTNQQQPPKSHNDELLNQIQEQLKEFQSSIRQEVFQRLAELNSRISEKEHNKTQRSKDTIDYLSLSWGDALELTQIDIRHAILNNDPKAEEAGWRSLGLLYTEGLRAWKSRAIRMSSLSEWGKNTLLEELWSGDSASVAPHHPHQMGRIRGAGRRGGGYFGPRGPRLSSAVSNMHS